jgi:hypothetical protein
LVAAAARRAAEIRVQAPAPPARAPPPALLQAAARRAAEIGQKASTVADCLGGWIKLDGIGEVPVFCDEAAALIDLAGVPEVQGAVEDAALERASELAGLQFAPRIPLARPEPPPNAIKTVATSTPRSSWPAEPPPNCGTKHAYWRFTDYTTGTKEWHCK